MDGWVGGSMDGWSIIANGVQENFILKSPHKLSSNFGCTRTLNFPSSHVYGHTAIWPLLTLVTYILTKL